MVNFHDSFASLTGNIIGTKHNIQTPHKFSFLLSQTENSRHIGLFDYQPGLFSSYPNIIHELGSLIYCTTNYFNIQSSCDRSLIRLIAQSIFPAFQDDILCCQYIQFIWHFHLESANSHRVVDVGNLPLASTTDLLIMFSQLLYTEDNPKTC